MFTYLKQKCSITCDRVTVKTHLENVCMRDQKWNIFLFWLLLKRPNNLSYFRWWSESQMSPSVYFITQDIRDIEISVPDGWIKSGTLVEYEVFEWYVWPRLIRVDYLHTWMNSIKACHGASTTNIKCIWCEKAIALLAMVRIFNTLNSMFVRIK